MNVINLVKIIFLVLIVILPMLVIYVRLILTLILHIGKKSHKSKLSTVNIPYYFEEMYQDLYSKSSVATLEILRKKARNRMNFLNFRFFYFGCRFCAGYVEAERY